MTGQTHAAGGPASGLAEGKFRRLLEAAPDAIVIADRGGHILLVNAQTEKVFGYRSSELIGQPVELLVPESARHGHVKHRADYDADPHARPMGIGMELFGRRKDGSTFPVEISLSPVDDGEEPLVMAAIRDISERKAVQEALRISEERFRLLVNEVKDYAIFMIDPAGNICSWNEGARRILGYQREEIIGKSFLMFYGTEAAEQEAPAQRLQGALERGRSQGEGWCVRKDGTRFWASAITTALHDQNGRLIGCTKIVQDITERKQAKEAFLLEVARALASNLDLRQLLAAIGSCLRQVQEFDFARMAIYDASTKMLKSEGLDERSEKEASGDALISPAGDSPVAWVFNTRKPLLLTGHEQEARPFKLRPAMERIVRSGCWLPLVGREGMLGVLSLLSRQPGAFTENDVEVFMQVGNSIAIALDNAMAFQEVSRQKEKLREEKLYLEDEIRTQFNFREIVGDSALLKQALVQVETVAPTDSTVLILGETGTGKELLARAVHNLSSRREATFVRLNCAAIPAGLIESELFGHEKGAFTGALTQRIGRLELAHRGTLFLDEVGDIPLELQAKLLRVLQEKEFERLGSTRTLKSDVRIVAATNRPLKQLVTAGQFRRDLYYRLNVFPIVIPPLRERPEDIPLLVNYFVLKHARKLKKNIENAPPEALRALAAYSWPGNIRELEHLIERAVILSRGPELKLPPFEVDFGEQSGTPGASQLEEVERQHILRVLKSSQGRIAGPGGAAEQLGMNRTTLNSKMRKLGISRKDFE